MDFHNFHSFPQRCTAMSPSQRRCVADDTSKLIVFELEHDVLTYLKYKPLP